MTSYTASSHLHAAEATASSCTTAFLGGGNMATAIISGMIDKGRFNPNHIIVIDRHKEKCNLLQQQFGIKCFSRIDQLPVSLSSSIHYWVLAVKPQAMYQALIELNPFLSSHQTLISIAAGLKIKTLEHWTQSISPIVRAMPNTPALVGQGVTGLFAPSASANLKKDLANILGSVSQLIWLEKEEDIDTITAISGSGPAYVFYMMHHLTQAAITLGFSAQVAKKLVLSTFEGAVSLAKQSPQDFATLQANVTSKGGTTAAAIATFEQAGLAQSILKGVQACHARAQSLAQELSEDRL